MAEVKIKGVKHFECKECEHWIRQTIYTDGSSYELGHGMRCSKRQ